LASPDPHQPPARSSLQETERARDHSRRRLLAPAAVYAVILGLSSLPGDRLDVGLPSGISYVAHAIEYGVLGAAMAWALPRGRRMLGLAIVMCVALGAVDETYQRLTPGRDPSLLDLAVDTVSASVAILVTRRRTARRRAA
jgi:VanZ family protein